MRGGGEGRARGCALARARKVHRSNAEVPRVEGGGAWPGPARPGPARPGPAAAYPGSGAPHGARLASKDLNQVVCPGARTVRQLIAPPAPARALTVRPARCRRYSPLPSRPRRPGPGARGPGPLPRPGIDDGPRTRAARCREVVLSCHEFRVACKALQLRAQSSGLQGQVHRADRPVASSRSAASVARRAVRVMCEHALLRACTIDRATALSACTIHRGPADGRAAPSHGVPGCRQGARPPCPSASPTPPARPARPRAPARLPARPSDRPSVRSPARPPARPPALPPAGPARAPARLSRTPRGTSLVANEVCSRGSTAMLYSASVLFLFGGFSRLVGSKKAVGTVIFAKGDSFTTKSVF